MPIIITSPLQKHIPSLTATTSAPEWSRYMTRFIDETHNEISSLISAFDAHIAILEHQKIRCADAIAILEEAGGLTVRARNFMMTPADMATNKDQVAEFATWFARTLVKLDTAVAESTFQGINLLNGDTLTTTFDTKGHNTLVTAGIPLTSSALGIRPPDFSTLFTIQNSRIDVMNAIDMVVTLRNIIAAHESTISISRDFALQTLAMAADVKTSLQTPDNNHEIQKLKALADLGPHILGDDPLADPPQHDTLSNFAAPAKMEDV